VRDSLSKVTVLSPDKLHILTHSDTIYFIFPSFITFFSSSSSFLPLAFTLVSCSAYFSTLKMEAIFPSEMSVDFQRTIRRYIPEESTLHNHRLRTSNPTHYVSATKPNRLMLFGETVAVYCENHTEHTDTLCGQNAGGTYSNHWVSKGLLTVAVVQHISGRCAWNISLIKQNSHL
jgi:hypothetical protein